MNSIQQTMPEAGQWVQLSFPAVEAVDPVGCQFVHQAGSVSLQYAPKDRPNQASDLMQPVVKSGGESLIVPDYVVNNKTRALTLRMTGGERILFESWFYFKARGTASSFTYTDPLGNSYTCCFASPELQFRETGCNAYECEITLLEV